MDLKIEAFTPADLPAMAGIWNQIVADGKAFPQEAPLSPKQAAAFFGKQDYTAVARLDGQVAGLYILHPNNVGRCGHQANASFAVCPGLRGCGVGEALVSDALHRAKALGYRLMIFNAVVQTNHAALHLYEKLGFQKIGTVPGGFHAKDGAYLDTVLFYHTL